MKRTPLWAGLRAALIALGLIATLATPAFADVVRSDKDHDDVWTGDIPTGTVTVDTDSLIPGNAEIETTGDLISYSPGAASNTRVIWAPAGSMSDGSPVADFVSIPAGQTASVNGTATLTWKDVATLQDGTTADLQMTLSEIFLDTPFKRSPPEGAVQELLDTDAHGPIEVMHRNGYIGPYLLEDTELIGMRCKVEVKIVKDGSPVEGTVLVSTVDLDVGNTTSKMYTEYHGGAYRESFRVESGDISDFYIPNDNVLEISGKKFTSTRSDEGTYMTGFVVLADAGDGMTLTWWGQGNGMGTKLFTGNISHQIKSSSGTGGTIKTTSSGKPGEGDEIGPGNVDVPDGKDQSYTLEPDTGYQFDSLTIDGAEVDPEDSSTWPDKVSIEKDADGNWVVTFEDNDADHEIHVEWTPKLYTVTYLDGDHGTSDGGGNQEDAPYGSKHDPGSGNTVTPDDGYRFTGTYTYQIFDDEGELIEEGETDDPSSIEVLGNIELTPVYERAYKVTYLDGDHGKSDGGGNQTDEPYGSPVTGGNKVTPDKNYRFTGKYSYTITHDDGTIETGETDDPTSLEITGDIEFTPIYQKTYTVTYVDPATGRVIQETITLDEGEPEPAAPSDPTRPGYKFAGWKRIVDADGNIVYEAQWEAVRVPSRTPRTSDPTSFVPMIASALGGLASIGAGAALRRRKR